MSKFQVSAIIVNYNSGSHAVDCIRSLQAQQVDGLEIIVVDNASQDDSIALLRDACGGCITLIESRENLGFGRANNLAAVKAQGEFLLLINPDAQLQGDGAVTTLVAYLQQNQAVGIAGPEIHEPSKNKYVLPRKTYPSQHRLKFTKGLAVLPGKIAWILGACLILRKSTFQQIHGFDPDFFLYGEDIDICLRVRKAGYAIGYCSAAKITHVGGASEAGAIPLDKFLRKRRGFYLFCRKHYDARDVRRIARHAIASAKLGQLNLAIREILRSGSQQQRQQQAHKLQAARIAADEVLSE
ncbi:MAG TPA: glycosyltransferase family 2 protein [Methylophilaceae bacterium]|nr:glycosyltransferase family 2 protein [Methylophilaceae bacterium]